MQDDLTRLKKLETDPRNDLGFDFRVYRFLLPLTSAIRKKVLRHSSGIVLCNETDKNTGHTKGDLRKWHFKGDDTSLNCCIELSAGVNARENCTIISLMLECTGLNTDKSDVGNSAISCLIEYRFYREMETINTQHNFSFICNGFGSALTRYLKDELGSLQMEVAGIIVQGDHFEWDSRGERPEAAFQFIRIAGRRIIGLLPLQFGKQS